MGVFLDSALCGGPMPVVHAPWESVSGAPSDAPFGTLETHAPAFSIWVAATTVAAGSGRGRVAAAAFLLRDRRRGWMMASRFAPPAEVVHAVVCSLVGHGT